MATNKNQHFVPRCYLRPFTGESAGKVINLFNIDRKQFISNASVKYQCSRAYFYGNDPLLEDAIQATEVSYSKTLAKVVNPNHVLKEEEANTLRLFWLFQYLRTEAAAVRAVQISESMIEATKLEDDSFRLNIKDAVKNAMLTFASAMHILDELECCIIRNRTRAPFITSDDPAILTNKWWFSDTRTSGRSFGLRSSGAIIMLPLSPETLFLAFDSDVYSLKNNKGSVDLLKENDVKAFNQHQILNCRANLFFKQSGHWKYVEKIFFEVKKNRLETRHRLNYAILESANDGCKKYRVINPQHKASHQEAIVHILTLYPQPLLWPTFLSKSLNNAVYTNGTGAGFLRFRATFQPQTRPFHRVSAY